MAARTQFLTVTFASATTVTLNSGTVAKAAGTTPPIPVFDPRGYVRAHIMATLGGGRTWGAEADFGDGNWVSLGTGKGTTVGLVVGPVTSGWTDGNDRPGMLPAQIRLTPSAVDAADSFTVRLSLT